MQTHLRPITTGWHLEHTYGDLPALFHTRVAPTPVRQPRLVVFNRPLAARLGLDADSLDGATGAAILAGNELPEGARPLAQAYAGHQFGHFTALGDGRAILLGEQVAPDGERFDIQLKGAGPTRYSRRGDGRATLGPMLREYIISEAMHGLGIPTTRSLAVVATGEPVVRERLLEGAVLTRVAASHLRVGTMEWAAAQRDEGALAALADYAIGRHYPELEGEPDRYSALFEAIALRQARLVAEWQLVGFIHGVMNTDNMALSGETIDYGPCAFMDRYDPATVFSSIDTAGRYAYGNQPAIAQWNLARLAEAMLPLLGADADQAVERANGVLQAFANEFDRAWLAGMRDKLGLVEADEADRTLVTDLLGWMQRDGSDYTNTFRHLGEGTGLERASTEAAAWVGRWRERQGQEARPAAAISEGMRRRNPAVIPRNHKVEEALQAATEAQDLEPLHRLLEALARPFDHDRDLAPFQQEDTGRQPYRTFCGT